MAKCAFGQIRMNYWGAADCSVSIKTIRKANKTITARNRLFDLNTVVFFSGALASHCTCAPGYLEIIGVGPIQFDRVEFGTWRFVELKKDGSSAAVDCRENGDVVPIVDGQTGSFTGFEMLRELRTIVNEYYEDVPDRSFSGSDTAQSTPNHGPLFEWWWHLPGVSKKGLVIGESVLLLPGSLGWKIVFHNKKRGFRFHYGSGKTLQKS